MRRFRIAIISVYCTRLAGREPRRCLRPLPHLPRGHVAQHLHPFDLDSGHRSRCSKAGERPRARTGPAPGKRLRLDLSLAASLATMAAFLAYPHPILGSAGKADIRSGELRVSQGLMIVRRGLPGGCRRYMRNGSDVSRVVSVTGPRHMSERIPHGSRSSFLLPLWQARELQRSPLGRPRRRRLLPGWLPPFLIVTGYLPALASSRSPSQWCSPRQFSNFSSLRFGYCSPQCPSYPGPVLGRHISG